MEARGPVLGKKQNKSRSGPSGTGQHLPSAQLEGCDSPRREHASHIPLAQTRSFLTEQTLVHSKGGMSLHQSAAETGLFPAPSCAFLLSLFLDVPA